MKENLDDVLSAHNDVVRISEGLDEMRRGQDELRASMKQLADALTRLTLVEERQSSTSSAIERLAGSAEKLDERVRHLELAEQMQAKTTAWAFRRSGAWLDQYYYGKYRGYNAGSSKVGSKAGQTSWGSVSFDNYRTYCSNNGADYHMVSLFEWHEILARAVIERKTFQLVPEASRVNPALCVYRGVSDFAYGPTSGVYVEWMDGIRTDDYGYYAVWGEAGGTYRGTGSAPPLYSAERGYYGQSLRSGGMFDSLFLAAALGPNTTCMIPDLNGGRSSTFTNSVCGSNFSGGYGYHGAFHSDFNYQSTNTHPSIGSRLAKW